MRIKLLNCLLPVFIFSELFAITDNPAFLPLPKGLTSNSVTTIMQDNQGFMWLGTFTGLNRYDGYSYKAYEYNLHDANTISNSRINDLKIDKAGNILIGTYGGGLNIFDPSTQHFRSIYLGKGQQDQASNNVTKILVASNSIIYAATENGLFVIQGDSSKSIALKSVKNLIVSCLSEDNSGNIWVGTRGEGLFKLVPGKNQSFEVKEIQLRGQSKNIRSMGTDYKGNIWISYFDHGFSQLIVEKGEIIEIINSSSDTKLKAIDYLPVQTIFCNSNGETWLGTENEGLAIIEPGNSNFMHLVQNEADPHSLPDNSIWSIFRDNSGIIWFGTYSHGAYRIDPFWNKFDQYTADNLFINQQLGKKTITSFCLKDSQSMLIATDGTGMYSYSAANGKRELKSMKQVSETIMEVVAFDNEYWVCSWNGGISIYSKDFALKQRLLGNMSVFKIIKAVNGNKWVATWGDGIFVISPENKVIRHFNTTTDNPSIISPNVFTLFEDSESRIWVGTLNGLSLISHSKQNTFSIKNYLSTISDSTSLSSNIVLSAFQDRDQNIWIGTSNGLNKYNPANNNFKRLHQIIPDKSFEVRSIIEGSNHHLWLGTNKGLIQFNIYSETARFYDESDGLPITEFRNNAVLQIDKDKLIFGGNGGVVIFDPKRIEDNPRQPNTIITDIRIFNRAVKIGEKPTPEKSISMMNSITLSPKMNVFTLEFTAINYTRPEKNTYEYMLEGLETSWNKVGNQRNATYSNLEPGEYTFIVRSTNNDGVYDRTPASLKIIVTPPFYRTWWFRIMLILSILGLAYAVVSIRMSELHRKATFSENLARLEKWKRVQIELEQERLKLGSQLDVKTHELAEINLQIAQKNEKLFAVHQQIVDILPNASRENYKKLVQMRKSLEEDINQKENWKALETGLNLTHDNFLQRFTEKYPKITHKDLKLVAYIRMNLSNKEIASTLNITLRSVESGRYRLRKRLDIIKDTNLNDFIMRF